MLSCRLSDGGLVETVPVAAAQTVGPTSAPEVHPDISRLECLIKKRLISQAAGARPLGSALSPSR